MMGSTLPPGDTSVVFAILKLLADPKAAEAKLKDLVEADAKAALKLKEISAIEVDVGIREPAIAEQAKKLAAQAADFSKREADVTKKLTDHAAANEAITKKLAEKDEDLAARERSLNARLADVNTREARFDEIDRRLKLREEQLGQDRAWVDTKIQEIKRLAG